MSWLRKLEEVQTLAYGVVVNSLDQFLHEKNNFLVIAGPCSIESEEQMKALLSAPNFTSVVRGGLFKMRTSPSSFQGLGGAGIDLVAKLKQERAFDFVTEVSDPRQIETVNDITSVFQIGSRSMYNYELLKELAAMRKPVILKRAFSASLKEWLNATEYLARLGEEKIILCERGIRTFETALRNTLDLGAVIYLKENTKFKVLVDPSHSMGEAKYVARASLAAMAAGADGLLIETHPKPSEALSDSEQAIDLTQYKVLIERLHILSEAFHLNLIL